MLNKLNILYYIEETDKSNITDRETDRQTTDIQIDNLPLPVLTYFTVLSPADMF